MSKTARAYCIRPLTVAIMLIAFAAAMAQENAEDKPKIAVYVVSDTLTNAEKESLEGFISTRFTSSGKYRYIERSNPILDGLNLEMEKQRGGEVDVTQISERGKQAGVPLVCVVRVWRAFSMFNIQARLMDTKTAEVIKSALVDMDEMKDYKKVKQAADELFEKIVPPAKAEEPKVVYVEKPAEAKPKAGYANYTSGERVGTFVLNFVPGLGSAVVMGDWTGALILLALGGGGAALVAKGVTDTEKNYHYQNPNRYTYVLDIGIWTLVAYLGFNIGFSADTNKPKDVVNSEYGNFNMAVLPNRHGGFAPYLMYNKAF